MLVTITEGTRHRNPHVPPEPRQFAHSFDANKSREPQANNFMIYAKALGESDGPYVVLRPDTDGWDERDKVWLEVELADWRDLVETATGKKVEIQ